MPDPQPDPPRDDRRPAPSRSDALLQALVIAWDLSDELAFSDALKAARLHTQAWTSWPRTTIRRTES